MAALPQLESLTLRNFDSFSKVENQSHFIVECLYRMTSRLHHLEVKHEKLVLSKMLLKALKSLGDLKVLILSTKQSDARITSLKFNTLSKLKLKRFDMEVGLEYQMISQMIECDNEASWDK